MHLFDSDKHSRHAFLRRSGQLALTGTALPFALNLAAMGEAAAFDATDYKALGCVFLYGGNDYANTVVTYDDPSYNQYSAIRGGGFGQTAGGIALAKSALGATLLNPTTPLPGGWAAIRLAPFDGRDGKPVQHGQGGGPIECGPVGHTDDQGAVPERGPHQLPAATQAVFT
jgi:hypothetical protein